jgi:hypothetical protein
MKDIHQRLGEIKERITDKSFRENKGLGNEIGFHIFDYEPKYEMLVRDYVFNLQKQIKKENSNIKIREFDLYEIMLEVLEQRGYLEKNFEIETRVTKNSISYKHPDHGKAIRGRSLGDKYNKEELENEFNGQEKSIFRNGANERGRAKGNSAFGYEGISDLDKEFERRADSLEQQINKDHRLNRERERAIQEQRENKRREEQGTKRENTRSLQDDDKEIRGIERASSREVRKGFEGSRKYQEISHGNDESIKSNSSSSRENRQTELEGQSKTICNSNGNNARSNIDNSRSIPVNKPNKVRDWDMER